MNGNLEVHRAHSTIKYAVPYVMEKPDIPYLQKEIFTNRFVKRNSALGKKQLTNLDNFQCAMSSENLYGGPIWALGANTH